MSNSVGLASTSLMDPFKKGTVIVSCCVENLDHSAYDCKVTGFPQCVGMVFSSLSIICGGRIYGFFQCPVPVLGPHSFI